MYIILPLAPTCLRVCAPVAMDMPTRRVFPVLRSSAPPNLCTPPFPRLHYKKQRIDAQVERYYRVFMYAYASTLRCASFLMVNSTWTKNHIDSLLTHRDASLDAFFYFCSLLGPLSLFTALSSEKYVALHSPMTVYPPCETQELVDFPLEGRESNTECGSI